MPQNTHHSINYIELPMTDVAATKAFYAAAFGWTFTDWGPSYISFEGAGIEGGFTADADVSVGGILPIVYSDTLEESQSAVTAAGGEIVQPIFSFPGGRRFHFKDPNGNHLAVWTTS